MTQTFKSFLKNLVFLRYIFLSVIILLGGCSSHHVKVVGIETPSLAPLYAKRGTYKIGKPYQVKGVWYTPREDFEYDQIGLASWYGPGFHQKTTANMEIFDQNLVSAAHKTLQLPCLVRVYNLDNGRVLDIRVNDRGPFYDGRIIDLSKRAAQLLGVFQKGLARVRVKVLKHESLILKEMAKGTRPSGKPPAPLPAKPIDTDFIKPLPFIDPPKDGAFSSEPLPMGFCENKCFVDLPILKNYGEAAQLSSRMDKFGPSTIVEEKMKQHGSVLYKVRVGPFNSYEKAQKILKMIESGGYSNATIAGT